MSCYEVGEPYIETTLDVLLCRPSRLQLRRSVVRSSEKITARPLLGRLFAGAKLWPLCEFPAHVREFPPHLGKRHAMAEAELDGSPLNCDPAEREVQGRTALDFKHR